MTETTELSTQLQLSLIYKKLYKDIMAIHNGYTNSQRLCVEAIQQAFFEAVNLLSQRCPKCDSTAIWIQCDNCEALTPGNVDKDL